MASRETPARARKARTTLQYSHDYFDHFHRNASYPGIPARRAIFTRFPIPRWPNSTRRPDPALNNVLFPLPGGHDRTGQELFRHRRTDDGAGRVVDAGVRALLASRGVVVERILGAGSQGLAVKVRVGGDGGRELVVKYASAVQTMVVEMWAMRRMVGARHIVQRRWIPGLSDKGVEGLSNNVMNHLISGDDDYTRDLAGLLNIDLNDPAQKKFIYAMEYMKYGNMNGLLREISLENIRLNSKELWRVFHCLFRACVALAYDGWADNRNPKTQTVPTQEEFAPFDDTTDQLLDTRDGLVDFDINDRNVMLGTVDPEDMNRGDSEEHSHDDVPVFKIGDLGIVCGYRGRHRVSMLTLASSRVLGNQWANTPEQFSQAWNYYGEDDADVMKADDGAAGKYDWWTNLWQVGRLMAMMINQYQPEVPPRCMRTPISKIDGTIDTIWTYGSDLLDDDLYSHYDHALRSTVAWCLAHRPRERPTMDDLEERIEDGIARDYPLEDQDDRRVTIATLLEIPPPAQPVRFGILGPFDPDM